MRSHALLWHGSAASVVDLHAANFDDSAAEAVDGTSQVGDGKRTGDLVYHALLWHGTPESVIDLNPAGFTSSSARAVSGENQVGEGHSPAASGAPHALLWKGTAASAVDLNPPGIRMSYGIDVSSTMQVGIGVAIGSDNTHAFAWNGTAASAVDLHPFLNDLSIAFTKSYASRVFETGVILGSAVDASNKGYFVLWTPQYIPGDFNHDDKVDTGDYVTWRNGLGTTYTQDDYNLWRSHFGQTGGSGSVPPPSSVPEPTSLALLLIAVTLVAIGGAVR